MHCHRGWRNRKCAVTHTAIATGLGNPNYALPENVTQDYTVGKAQVAIPDKDMTEFTYTGSEQTYTIADSGLYSVSGNVQTNADNLYGHA